MWRCRRELEAVGVPAVGVCASAEVVTDELVVVAEAVAVAVAEVNVLTVVGAAASVKVDEEVAVNAPSVATDPVDATIPTIGHS